MNADQQQTIVHEDMGSDSMAKDDGALGSNWVSPGRSVTVHGIEISSGLFYLGTRIFSPDGKTITNDPSIINPSKPVDRLKMYRTPEWYGARTSYQQMSASDRAVYLEWLARGRTGGVPNSHLLVFFSGLERRVLVDARHSDDAMADVPVIEAEVRRLLKQYGGDYTFQYQATQFLLAIQVLRDLPDLAMLTPPDSPNAWEFPMELKLALGMFAVQGKPVPAEWALSWAQAHPDVRMGTAANRCPKEFRELFVRRYAAEYGDGIRLTKNKARVKFYYSPTNRSLWGSVSVEAPDLPDVSRQRKSVGRLALTVMRVSTELDAYSRWAGQHHDRHSLRAVSLLPPELASRRIAVKRFTKWLEQRLNGADHAFVPIAELVSTWSLSTTGSMTKREAERLSEFLESCRYGFEPDSRYGGVSLSTVDTVILFRLPKKPEPVATETTAELFTSLRRSSSVVELRHVYRAALTLLRLALVVALQNGTPSSSQVMLLERFIARAQPLTDAERARLLARLHWGLKQPQDVKGLKVRCSELESDDERQAYGRFLIGLAGIHGGIGPAELKTLEKVYSLLGLKHADVSRDVHVVATATAGPASEPVTIIPAEDDAPSFALPAEPTTLSPTRVNLSTERVAAIIAESHLVSEVLGSVFAEGEPDAIVNDDDGHSVRGPDDVIPGLDEPHSTLARQLAQQSSWPRAEVERLSHHLGLMTAGAIEAINHAAFEFADEPFIEGDDPLEVNMKISVEFIHA